MNDKIYFVGGYDGTAKIQQNATILDQAMGDSHFSFSEPSRCHTAVLNDDLYAIGGNSNSVEIYNPQTGL